MNDIAMCPTECENLECKCNKKLHDTLYMKYQWFSELKGTEWCAGYIEIKK